MDQELFGRTVLLPLRLMFPNLEDADVDMPLEVTRQIDALCDEYDAALRLGAGACLEEYAGRIDLRWRNQVLEELAHVAIDRLRKIGISDPQLELLDANPSAREELSAILSEAGSMATVTTDHRTSCENASGLAIRCPHCHGMIELVVDASLMEISCDNCGGTFSLVNDAQDTRDASTITRMAHFELIERLGMGQFGTVWKARDMVLERTVALKIPRKEQLDSSSIEKVMREARAAAQLRHPNIVSTHEVGRHGDTLYIVNEYIRGVPLSVTISDGRLGIHESVTIVTKIADALEHAHSAGVIHRDVKPSNVLIDDHGEPHLMDFGLAKRSDNEIMMTTEGAVLGTPAYMSPEQARGEAYRVDGRSDLYSLGVILFQLLTGELPFRGSTRILLQKVINDEPSGPRTLDSRVPRDVDTICLKCLEKEPSRRYVTSRDLAADLRRFLAGQPVAARRIGRLGRTIRWARRNKTIASLLSATITTLLAATIVSSYFAWRAAENALRADQQAKAVTDTLYESLLQEIRLTGEVRKQGYGVKVRQLVNRARDLTTVRVDKDELRRQLTLTMGDFVAYPPRVISPSQGQVTSFCLSGDGREVFVGLNNGRLIIYDSSTGSVRAELEALSGDVVSLVTTARGDGLLAADKTGKIRVWRRMDQNWEAEREFSLRETPQSVFFSPDGERVIYSKEALLEIWDVATGTMLRSLPTEPDWLMQNGAFDMPRGRLVAGYVNKRADRVGWALWELETGERLEFDMPSLGDTYPDAIDVTKAGDRMAIGFDEALLVYDLKDFQRTRLSGFDATKAVAFSPTSPYLAAANIRGWITVWNSATNRQLATLQLPTATPSRIGLGFSADGGRLAASNADSIQIWDLTRADEKMVMAGHNGGIPCAVFQPNGRLLVTGGKDDEVRFWDPFTGQPIGSCNVGEAVQTLAFSPDGKLLAVGCMGRADAPHLRLIDVNSKKVIYEAKPAMGDVFSLAWSEVPAGRYLAGCGAHGVALWRVSESLPVRMETILELDRTRCLATVLDHEAGFLVWAGQNRLSAWDLAAGKEVPLHAPDMNQGWHGVALLPDGQSIIYVSKMGVAEVWNVKEDRQVASFGERGTFNAPEIALSPDGKWFAALTQPDTVSIWHRPTGELVFSLRPEAGTVWSLAWDPFSQQLAVGQSDGGLAVWHLPKIQEKLAESGLRWQDED